MSTSLKLTRSRFRSSSQYCNKLLKLETGAHLPILCKNQFLRNCLKDYVVHVTVKQITLTDARYSASLITLHLFEGDYSKCVPDDKIVKVNI